MKKLFRIQWILHFFIGLGAIGGGMMALLNPQGPDGMPANVLDGSPFHDFLVPGIFLLVVLGLGNIFCGIMTLKKSELRSFLSGVWGVLMVLWIIIQCVILNAIVELHVIFFVLGLVQAVLAAVTMFRLQLFPANLLIIFYRSIKQDRE